MLSAAAGGEAIKQALRRQAAALGIQDTGFCRPDAVPELPTRLAEFINAGRHGTMGWLAANIERRASPSLLWPAVRTIVMLAESYTPDCDPRSALLDRDSGTISVYARNRDYHQVLKKKIKWLAGWLASEAGSEVKVFVDTAPVAEKNLGQAAGLGWQGKHSNLVSRRLGSWFFLGTIFTDAELPPDRPGQDRCGSCRACLDICPTDAFVAPYQLDARKCISYLTIEHRGPVDPALRPGLGNRIYGCDDCLAVCPWNKFARSCQEIRYHARPELVSPALADLAGLDDADFRSMFVASPIKRIGRERFVRNVLYAVGNSSDRRLEPVARARCEDSDPAVADAARWAVAQLQGLPLGKGVVRGRGNGKEDRA